MHDYEGRVSEIQLWNGQEAAWIACPQKVIPGSGRYVLAWSPGDEGAPLATPLFAAQVSPQGFLAAPPTPRAWEPGARLLLRGPLGRGFRLPSTARRLALAVLGEGSARLLPLMQEALEGEAAVALFTDGPLPRLPTAVEIGPLSGLAEALAWADFLALDVPLEALPNLDQLLGLEPDALQLPCTAQALVVTVMPCGGLAECGACGIKGSRGWKLACKDGPVFDLATLMRAP